MRDDMRPVVWFVCGIAVILGLAWVGTSDPVASTSEVVVIAGDGRTSAASTVIAEMFMPGGYHAEAIDSSSILHVVSATLDGSTVDLYTYNSVFEDRGAMRCALAMSSTDTGGGGGGGCPADGQSTPSVGGGFSSGGRVGGKPDYEVHTLTVAWGPDDAALMIVETADRQRIKSNVVAGHSIAMWPGPFETEARVVTLFDDEKNVLWTHRMNAQPSVPVGDVHPAVPIVPDE